MHMNKLNKTWVSLIALMLMSGMSFTSQAQRVTDKLSRGLVAVPAISGGGNVISWRVFGEEYYDVTYNLYCNGELLAKELKASNYQHTAGNATSKYQVAPVVRGVEQEKCSAVTRWNKGYLEIPVQKPVGRDGKDASAYYTLNDISLGDLTGNGIVEFIVKRPAIDARNHHSPQVFQNIHFNQLDCYDISGNRLWWIDLGPNMISGPDEQWDCVCYDWDQDGKAEVLLRCQDGTIIHYADGTTETIGDPTVDTRSSVVQDDGTAANLAYTNAGNEYLLYLEGATGKPYEIGPSTHPHYMAYPVPRGNATDWGDGSGHRSTKHYWGAPFLDGRKASIFIGRGCYTMHKFTALDVDPETHKLTTRWSWECTIGSSSWFGNGYHNFAVGDVDWDGRDEIIFGSMVIDDNGKGLSTTGYGHGDAQHCSDFDPYRKYEEQFGCLEEGRGGFGCNFRNAVTSQVYVKRDAGGDDGRALMGNFTNAYPGSVGRSVSCGWFSSVADKTIDELNGDAFISWGDLNQRIYWDGDLLDEYFESPGTEGYGAIYKPAGAGRWNFPDSKCNNYSKNNPGAIADILGDWREELVMRRSDNAAILVYTTNIPTAYRIPTLWHDHQYRNAMVWQSMGYNQPPHKSYFLGEMEGITVAPPSLTMTGRTEVANGGTITTTDEHLLVCEFNDTEVSIAEGAAPYMVTFYVPSWVQGNAGSNTSAKPAPTYNYYTCNVTGGGLSGTARLVKQGDGILNLPAADFTHSGETNIWGGILNFNGTMHKSDLWLNRFTELNGSAAFHSLKADYGAIIRPGGEGNVGQIQVDSTLYLGFGSRVVVDLDEASQTSDCLNAKTIVIETKNWKYGPKYMMPILELAGNVGIGTYCIATADSLNGSLSNLRVEGTNGFKCALQYKEGKIYLTLGKVRGPSHIYWTGCVGQVWDYATTENFSIADGDQMVPEVFVSGDIVEFNDDAETFNVTLKDEVSVDTFLVNNTKAYTIGGTGKIVAGAFVKEGTGRVTITGDHTYTGGNYLRGGTTIVNALSSATQAYGCLGAPLTATNKFVMSNGAVLQTTSDVQNNSLIQFTTSEGGVLMCNAGFTQQKALTGTVCTKKGGGTLSLSLNNAGLSKMVIAGGTVSCASLPAKTVEIQSGTLSLGDASSVPIEVTGNNAKLDYRHDRGEYTNVLTGNGTVTIYYPTVKGSNADGVWYATRTLLKGDWSAFEGTVIPMPATKDDGRFCLNNNYGLAKGTMDIPEGTTVENSGMAFAIGRLTGTGKLGGTCSFTSTANTGVNTWNVGSDSTFAFDGQVVKNAIFNKVGRGEMTVNGEWTTTGAVNIKEGHMILTRTTSNLGTGKLTVSSGAMLISTDATFKNSSVVVDGTLYPGSYLGDYRGAMHFNGQNVTINEGGTLRVCMRKAGTGATTPGGSGLKNIGTLTLKGTLLVDLYHTYTPKVGDALRIFAGVTNFVGNPTIVCSDENVTLDGSRLSEGIVVVANVNESSIETLVNSASETPSAIYDLSGRRVAPENLVPGRTYMVNGRKYVIK